MSRSRMYSRVMFGVAALAAALLTTACSDVAGPPNEDGLTFATPRTEAPSDSPTTAEIAPPPESGKVEGTSEAGSPSFAYASATLPNIRGCFTYTTGAAYKYQPVYILYWVSGTTWAFVRNSSGTLRSRTTDANGCVQFDDVPTGKYLALEAYTTFGFPTCQIWSGVSAYIGPTAKNDVLWRTGYTTVALTKVATPDSYSQACLNWR